MKPNWCNADEYPRAKGTPPSVWAWEFLRRNPDYIEDWITFKSRIGEYADRYPNLSSPEMAEFLMDKRFKHVVTTRAINSGDYRKTETPLTNYYGRKWGLMQIADPDASYDQRTHRWIAVAGGFFTPGTESEFDDPTVEFVGVDLTLPLEPQLRDIKAWLKKQRVTRSENKLITLVPMSRSRPAEWLEYLRVIDGNASGADRSEMASALLSTVDNSGPDYLGSKNIDNWLKKAKELLAGGYRALPLIPEK